MRDARAAVERAKRDYADAIKNRSSTQREVNELLHRKDSWSMSDLERFTKLYKNDHTSEQAELAAQITLKSVEEHADAAQEDLLRGILQRYHEEQIWSDKIRRASTWGTWGIMGINLVLFISVQVILEPWKRNKLVDRFDAKVALQLEEQAEKFEKLEGVVAQTKLAPIIDPVIDSPIIEETNSWYYYPKNQEDGLRYAGCFVFGALSSTIITALCV